MNGQDFIRIVQSTFWPSLEELGFQMDTPSISGRLYRASFSNARNVVSISYEPGDSAQFVMIFTKEKDILSDIDDRSKTPRLSDLNNHYMHMVSSTERAQNDVLFSSVHETGEEEKCLIKAAKELRLVLPKYLSR